MGHNGPKPPPGFRPATVAQAHWVGEPVVLWCLDCASSRQVSAWTLFHRRGDLAFGSVHGGFHCRSCRRSAVVVVLPVDAPSPRAWAARRAKPPPGDDEQRRILLSTEHLPWRIDEWDEDGNLVRLIAKARDHDIARRAFEALRAPMTAAWRVTLREGVVEHASYGQGDKTSARAPQGAA